MLSFPYRCQAIMMWISHESNIGKIFFFVKYYWIFFSKQMYMNIIFSKKPLFNMGSETPA